MNKAEESKYMESHEWVHADGDIATVGISDHAQHEISDIVFVELPRVGDKVTKGERCAVVESVKAASDIYSPVSGEVVEVNTKVSDEPSLVNQSAQEEGWFFKVKMSDKTELDSLMNYDQYTAKNK